MAERGGHPVGRIGGGRRVLETELALHHERDLILRGVPVADHGLLDLPRRVLGDRQLPQIGGQQDRAAGMPELERTLRVLAVEDLLDRHHVRVVPRQQHGDFIEDLPDTPRDGFARRGADDAALDQPRDPAPPAGDDAVAGRRRAGIDPEHHDLVGAPPVRLGHARYIASARTASSMSALEWTFCTSSSSSSISSSRISFSASLPPTAISLLAMRVSSAELASMPAASRPCWTAEKSLGSAVTMNSSPSRSTSWAPASMAASNTASSV